MCNATRCEQRQLHSIHTWVSYQRDRAKHNNRYLLSSSWHCHKFDFLSFTNVSGKTKTLIMVCRRKPKPTTVSNRVHPQVCAWLLKEDFVVCYVIYKRMKSNNSNSLEWVFYYQRSYRQQVKDILKSQNTMTILAIRPNVVHSVLWNIIFVHVPPFFIMFWYFRQWRIPNTWLFQHSVSMKIYVWTCGIHDLTTLTRGARPRHARQSTVGVQGCSLIQQ